MSYFLYPKNKLPVKEVQKFILIFYVVGVIGFLLPWTKNLFVTITPLALLLGTYLLAIYHTPYTKNALFSFAFIFLAGFFLEVVGVNTGKIFGSYAYGSGLGFKLWNTPLLIGVNWLFLTYTSISVVTLFLKKEVLIVLSASSLMLVYDLFLEQVAPKMDMWSFKDLNVPLDNYLAWFIFASLFVTLLRVVKVNTKNPVAPILFLVQLVFFIFLSFFL